jgi:iron complex outermembrane receptor protein
MELTTVLLLLVSAQIFAASLQRDDKAESMNNEKNRELLASVTFQSGSYNQLIDVSKGKTTTDDQQKIVTGRITDNSGVPLPGVNVLEKNTTNGVISDADGKFTITVASPSSVLVFSFIGFNSHEEVVGSLSTINVSLSESLTGLDEIIVVGYGTQQKRAISGSVTSVSEKSFNAGVTRTAADLLQGKVAGLAITTASGDVTSTQTMRLRGTSSLTGSSEPFVVIDGVPGLSMNNVAPQDIESISILKDASAAAIYGSRSASGVILITTKKGVQNRTVVDYNGYVAFDKVTNKPDVLTAAEWRQYAVDNSLNVTAFDRYGATTDWFGEIMRTGVSQNHDLSVSGAGTNNSYRLSISLLDQQGVVKDNFQNRINTRFSVNQKALKDHLDLSLSGGLNQRDYQPAEVRNFVLSYNMLPVFPIKLDDGTWYDNLEYDQGNPVRNIEYNSNLYKTSLFYINLKANVTFTKNLSAGVNVYKERSNSDRFLYQNSTTERGRTAMGYGQRSFSTGDKGLIETTVNYTGKIGSHSINVLGGYSFENNYSRYASASNRQFVTNLFDSDNLAAGENLQTGDASSSASMNLLASFFGRLNYSFKDRYLLSATVRRDGSSKFGPENQWGTFPSVSVAWRLSDESFMERFSSFLDEFKIRAGYGVSGNQDGLSPYQSLSLYGSSGTYYDSGAWHTAYAVSQNPNPDLKWESTSMTNVGIDFSFFEGRINGTIEYYDKVTKDLLYSYAVPVPPYMYASMVANVGSMGNKGIEVMLNGDIFRTNNLRWNVSVNFAHNENKIISLSNAEFTTASIKTGSAWVRGGSANTTHIVEEGKQVGQFYGPRCLGLDADGKYIIDDMVDGIPGVTVADYTYIGEAQPKLTYGFNNSITYKAFELTFFLRGVWGNDVLNFSKMSYATTQWLPGANVLHDALTIGLKTSPIFNSFYIEKGSFARLDNATFSYSLTPDILGISRIRLYTTTHNLFTLTKYTGVDPELQMSGLDPGIEGREYYPKSRTFLFGVNVTF